jgi:hypothetical protein
MLTRYRVLFIAAVLTPLSAQAAPENVRVYSQGGNIFAERSGTKTQLTKSAHDAEPVLLPDGSTVAFTRKAGSADDDDQFCDDKSKDDELLAISIDGKNERVLLHGRKGEGGRQLCGFRSKQFTSDGHSLYFLTPGWATSGALHVYDMRKQAERYVMPANDVIVLNFCKNEHQDRLAVQQHRYMVFGGSYDWYWLYDAAGKKEIGPVSDSDNPDDLAKRAREEWCR